MYIFECYIQELEELAWSRSYEVFLLVQFYLYYFRVFLRYQSRLNRLQVQEGRSVGKELSLQEFVIVFFLSIGIYQLSGLFLKKRMFWLRRCVVGLVCACICERVFVFIGSVYFSVYLGFRRMFVRWVYIVKQGEQIFEFRFFVCI